MATHTAAFEPKVIRTFPRNLGKDISAKATITIDFNTDLDRDYINTYLQVTNEEGKRIDGIITYNERTITFVPEKLFESHATVRVRVIGDDLSGKQLGIRSVLGERMRGNYDFSFTVAAVPQLAAPVLTYPTDQGVINKNPIFKWDAIDKASHYIVQVSTSNTMSPVIWPAQDESHRIFLTADPLDPIQEFEDGIYYWRVRAVDASGILGEWSQTYQFCIDTQVEGFVAEGDTPPQLGSFEGDGAFELLEVFPEDGFSNVGTNLKTIYIHVLGTFTTDQVQNSFTITAEPIDGDDNNEENLHLDIEGVVEAYPQGDGTTIITFTLDELEE